MTVPGEAVHYRRARLYDLLRNAFIYDIVSAQEVLMSLRFHVIQLHVVKP